MKENDQEIDRLNNNIEELNDKIDQILSFKRRFLLSLVNGVGNIIGATIIAALLLAALSRLLQELGGLPFVQEIINNWLP
jgi:hypothetical protein